MLFLCFSDIHGHVHALKAALAAARSERPAQKILVAGDLLFPGPAPLETWMQLQEAGAVLVQGIGDKALATLDPKALPAKTAEEKRLQERLRVVQKEVGADVLQALKKLPTKVRFPLEDGGELLLVHGSPVDPTESITHDMSDDEIALCLGNDSATVVVCGMSHVPFDRVVGSVHVINVGSVGEAPDGIGQESTHDTCRTRSIAHATWVDATPSGVDVKQIVVSLL